MRRLLFLCPLLLAACWPFGGNGGSAVGNAVMLCVENAAVGYGNVIARSELVRIDVLPGQTVCEPLGSSITSSNLTATTTGGGARGPLFLSDRLPSTLPGCWLWYIAPAGGARLSSIDCADVPGARTSHRAHPAGPAPLRPPFSAAG